MSNLNISERRRPQSGKMSIRYQNKIVEYRVEVTPMVDGTEDVVLRILTSFKTFHLMDLGFSGHNLTAFKEILSKPYGLILCVGPTGSGKTTTLHAGLAHLNSMERKIWTAEDPVEITQRGLRQVQINPNIGFTFQDALRSFLRSDPDVIMVGEMRDVETAKTVIEAALTGHLVLSTLHTNSAAETLVRLTEMGMDPFNFADSILGVLAQRLTRRLCESCKEEYHPSYEEHAELMNIYNPELFKKDNLEPYSDNFTLMRKVGCEQCDGSGYRGRIALHELIVTGESIKKAIKARATTEALKDLAIAEGTRILRMDGIQKVLQGITDIDQISTQL